MHLALTKQIWNTCSGIKSKNILILAPLTVEHFTYWMVLTKLGLCQLVHVLENSNLFDNQLSIKRLKSNMFWSIVFFLF